MIRTEQKEVYQIMVSGHLRERDGIYYMVLSYLDYVYVNDLGELVKPGYLTQAFLAILGILPNQD